MDREKEEQNELLEFQNSIQNNFPEFKISIIKKLGEGWMSKTILINDEWVFRFPKKRDGANDLEKEIKIMPYLADQITLAIPKFEYVGKQKNGLPFVGYKIIPGKILGEDAVPSLPKNEKKTIAQQIARFIDELSAFPIDKARVLGVPENDFYKDYTNTFEKVKQKVFPLINENMQYYISSRFETYLDNPENFQYTPTLIHADLSPDHYLINPQKRKLTGIIDFGDIEIGDPDYEYLYILEDCGKSFTRQVMEMRGQNDIEKRLAKIAIFVTVDEIGTILEGINKNDQQMINSGIKIIRNEMK